CKACGDDVRPFLGNHLRTKKLPLEFQFSGGSSLGKTALAFPTLKLEIEIGEKSWLLYYG
ncbi:MAG: hypothetical protein K0S07_1704, partial [Chlamydiales bacterium]|nr:hypothetical protein [Chlamydiales bacterium]